MGMRQESRPDLLCDVAGGYAASIVRTVQQVYPNDLHHPMTSPHDRPRPRQIHPSFYGCYDWHSCVEMHWALVRLLRLPPDAPPASDVRTVLHGHLTADALATETAYLDDHPRFERPTAGDGRCCSPTNCPPGTTRTLGAGRRTSARWPTPSPSCSWRGWRGPPVVRRRHQLSGGLGAQRWRLPVTGAHRDRADERGAPTGGVRRLVGPLPAGLANGHPSSLFEPAIVSDPTDGQIVHLHGLNLYRAADWRLRGLHLDPGSGRMVPETQVGRSALAQRHPPGEGAAAAADRCV